MGDDKQHSTDKSPGTTAQVWDGQHAVEDCLSMQLWAAASKTICMLLGADVAPPAGEA